MAFRIDPIGGELKPAPISRTATGDYPVSAATDAAGRFLYVSTMVADAIAVYAIDPTNGTLTPVDGSPFSAGNRPSGNAIHPNGRFLYVTNLTTGSVVAFEIDRVTGALKPLPGSRFPAGTNPWAIAVEPDGRFAYVVNAVSNDVSRARATGANKRECSITESPHWRAAAATAASSFQAPQRSRGCVASCATKWRKRWHRREAPGISCDPSAAM